MKRPDHTLPNLRRSFVLLLVGMSLALKAETEDRIEKTFQVGADGKLIGDADLGAIEVHGMKTSRVSVEVT